MTTKAEISNWFDEGIRKNATHMLVVCDTYDYEDYPVYITKNNLDEEIKYYNEQSMQKIMEVYNLSLNKEEQLNKKVNFKF